MISRALLLKTTTAGLLLCMAGAGGAMAHGSHAPLAAEKDTAKPDAAPTAGQRILDALITPAEAAANITVSKAGGKRIIRANGLPRHGTGRFPNRGNPHSIRAQSYRFQVPLNPRRTGRITRLGRQPFGVAINGVVFDPGTAEYWGGDPRSGWRYEALGGAVRLGLDRNNAHVQPNGAYHYHAAPKGLMARGNYRKKPMLIGWAADGFPIYTPYGYRDPKNAGSGMKLLKSSYRIRRGNRPSGPGGRYDGSFVQDYAFVRGAGDLDACNGRTGVTPEFPSGTYHYVVSLSYPFIPRCYMGSPDPSFRRHGPPMHAFGRPGRPGRPGFGRPGPGGRFGGPSPRRFGGPPPRRQFGGPPPRGRFGGPGRPGPRQAGFRPGGGPPRAALSICRGKAQGARCSFSPPGRGRISGRCLTTPRGLRACVPDHRFR